MKPHRRVPRRAALAALPWRVLRSSVPWALAAGIAFAAHGTPGRAQEGTVITHGNAQQRASGSTLEEVDSLPVIRPDFPVPDDPGMVFYLQRSTNSNTVVYAARFLDNGKLDPRQPVMAYWRRFNTTGERLPLKMIEDSFAFGVRARATDDPDVFTLHVVSYPERRAILRLVEPGRAELLLPVDGRRMRMRYAYVDVDESGLVPSVREVVVTGHDVQTGRALVERIQIE